MRDYSKNLMKIADLTNGKTPYHGEGAKDAPVFLLVHGLSTSHEVWCEIAPLLQELGFQTLIYDLYGRGGSDAGHKRYDLNLYRQQIIELLEWENIHSPIHLLGYSMGGGIAADFAANYPLKVKSLHLLAPIGMKTHLKGYWSALKTPFIGAICERYAARALRADINLEAKSGCVPQLIHDAQLKSTYKAGYMRAIRLSMQHINFNDLSDIHHSLKKHPFPAQAIWAEKDAVIPLEGCEMMGNINPKMTMNIIKGASHSLAYTHSRAVIDALSQHLAHQNLTPDKRT